MTTPEAGGKFHAGIQPARPEAPVVDPRTDFVAQRYARRKNRFIQQFGMQQGPRILAAERALVTEIVTYLDTPPGQRAMNETAFLTNMGRKGTSAGVHGVVNRGRDVYRDYKEAKEKEHSTGS
jgi:hypothetical protein